MEGLANVTLMHVAWLMWCCVHTPPKRRLQDLFTAGLEEVADLRRTLGAVVGSTEPRTVRCPLPGEHSEVEASIPQDRAVVETIETTWPEQGGAMDAPFVPETSGCAASASVRVPRQLC